ncbi:MAG TPA: glycosyltransferase [Polyangia bacterium]|jgi:UDP:flavonoid glycosyltransferase YjiC (YdhE family)|nr:glycosyltransferase [Polyangia bacterium]
MRIAITTFGTEGDIRPFIALTRRLCQAGHDAWLVAPPLYVQRAAENGVPLRAAGRSWSETELRQAMAAVMHEKHPLRQAGLIFESLADRLIAALPDVIQATRPADVIIHHQIDVTGFAAAEVHRKPRITGHLFHGSLRACGIAPDGRNFGALGNRLMTHLLRFLMSRFADAPFNRVLAAAGLKPRRPLWAAMSESPLLNLLAISPALVPPDPLWCEQRVVQTGYWFLDTPTYNPPRALTEFMAAGEPPVVVTFGSMVSPDARAQTDAVVGALTRLGRRAILQAGWNPLGQTHLPPNFLRVDYVPHDWLFPRAACVVHHGGAGTTAAVTRAGVPHMVVHHLADQPYWAQLLYQQGLAARPLHHRQLTAERLFDHLATVVDNAGMQGRARALGQRVQAEDGLSQAVAAIEFAVRMRGLRTGDARAYAQA